MKRKLLALGAVALMAASVQAKADSANVTLYGTFNSDLEYATVGGSVDQVQPRLRIGNNSSNFGLKGSEDLGNDWKGIFQVESNVSIPGMTTATTTAGTTFLGSTISSRNTFIGAATPWGTVAYGIMDTPMKTSSLFIEPFYATGVGYLAAITSTPGFGAASITSGDGGNNGNNGGASAASFDRRQGQSIMYTSPTWSGVTLRAMYSTPTDKSPTFPDPSLWGASLTYDANHIYAAYAYEHHSDFKGTSALGTIPGTTTTSDNGHKATVGYAFSDQTRIGIGWSNLGFGMTDITGTSTTTSRNAYVVGATYGLTDAITLRGGFATAGSWSTDTASTTDAQMLALGASYSFSKRTDAYFVFSKIWNDSQANYNFAVNAAAGAAAGDTVQAIGLGLRHVF